MSNPREAPVKLARERLEAFLGDARHFVLRFGQLVEALLDGPRQVFHSLGQRGKASGVDLAQLLQVIVHQVHPGEVDGRVPHQIVVELHQLLVGRVMLTKLDEAEIRRDWSTGRHRHVLPGVQQKPIR
jgi:hypothetical protein